jgi:hypothetical protein
VPRSGSSIVLGALVLCAAIGCGRSRSPFQEFTVTHEIPPAKGQPAAVPPEGALRPWRVWVNQEYPRQKKAPAWRSVDAKQGSFVDLAEDGKWRCLVNPVHVVGKANERGKIASWVVTRSVRCSADGFRTSVEGRVLAAFDADGRETQTTPSAPLYLSDTVAGQRRFTAVVLEGEKTTRRPEVD